LNYLYFKNGVVNAAKWSSLTEVAVRLISPITHMILARVLVPDAFGVVATVSMIISFADMLTDSGFQKYLVQHEFNNEKEKFQYTTVAFWTNLSISILLWVIITIFSEQIATMVGNKGLGNVITIAGLQLPLTSFSSIQMALYKRNFDFKTLFLVRTISLSLPFVLTIPLALMGFSYWSLIVGTISGHLFNAIILTYKSKWKPTFFFNMQFLKEMLSFSIWSLIEAISIWLSTWVDTLIIGSTLNSYYLGLYKTSLNIVNALITIVTASITPILFSTLSRLQNEDSMFRSTFFKVQEIVAYVIFPIGVGLFIFHDLVTKIMLGEKWTGAGFIIGIWGLTSAIMIVYSDLNSECYRAKGMPKLSFALQVIYLLFLIPTCITALRYGFNTLVYVRTFIRFELMITSMLTMQLVLHISIKESLKRTLKPAIFSVAIGFFAFYFMQLRHNMLWNLISILLSILVYGFMVRFFAREEFKWILDMLEQKSKI